MNPIFKARMDGVRHAVSADTDVKAPPQTVLAVVEAKVRFVQYTNARGDLASAMFFCVDGPDGSTQMVSTKDTEEWCGRLFPMSEWMKQQVDGKLRGEEADKAPLPDGDSVDVLG